jgi:hypothetical protein
MKKFYLLSLLFLVMIAGFSQAEYVALPGGTELVKHEISAPDQTNYSFYDVIKNGNWNPNRELDFDSLNMTFKGSWPLGQSFSLSYSGNGNIFLVGSGAGVIVLDASDPANPQEKSLVRARGLVDASYFEPFTSRLYLAAYFSGIEIWDVAGWENPTRLARIPTTSYPRGGVFASGNYVYAITVADGVYVYNTSDLGNITQEGHAAIPSSQFVWNSAMEGTNIFCAASNGGCKIIDVSNPANPQIKATVSGISTGVCVKDNILYMVSYNYGLKIYDVSNLSNIQQIGQLPITGYPYRVSVKGNYVYVANSTSGAGGGMQIIDVSDPTVPVLVSSYSGYADYVAVGENVAAIVGGGRPCSFLDVSDVSNPQLESDYKLPAFVSEVFVQGDMAITGSNGFRVFDISDKTKPEQIGYNETAGDLAAVSGNLAVYIPKSMGAPNPVNIMDISDPTNPVKRGHYQAPVMTYDLDLVGNYAFIACWWDGFRVVNFGNPDNPVLAAHKFGWVNSNSVPGVDFCYVQALDTYGNYLYLIDYKPFEAEDTKGLYIFDITNPANPVFVSRYSALFSQGYGLEAQGNYVYVADMNGGMEIIDVSDPANPYSTGYVFLPDVAWSVAVDGNYAYTANYILGGVQTIDISDPTNPFIAGFYQPSGCFGVGITMQGSYTYLADGVAGFQIHENLIITGIDDQSNQNSDDLKLYPNPASSEVFIAFNLKTESNVSVNIYDMTGKRIRQLFAGNEGAGEKTLSWDGNLDNGNLANTGIYLVKIETGNHTFVSKVSVVR